jgi:8-oxo-dGTP pyrophosphatase MutT (NUDIX family)
MSDSASDTVFGVGLVTPSQSKAEQEFGVAQAGGGENEFARQQQVAQTNAAKDSRPNAAGLAIVEPGGQLLFVRRAGNSDYGGHWAFPGGSLWSGESGSQAAGRETWEEIGWHEPGGRHFVHRMVSDSGVDFETYTQNASRKFEPKLNHEHDEYMWAMPNKPPSPLHPGVKVVLPKLARNGMANDSDVFAFDRASARAYDQDGHLHVSLTNISKANVCPYFGAEIPRYREMGLDAKRVYMLLRHPDELKKAKSTFNNLPLLSRHVPMDAASHRQDLVVGSTGTDAAFDGTYLKNSIVVWSQGAIDSVNSGKQKELSCAYRYDADMTPGVYQGVRYDGVMRNIKGNHVALVSEGRAGSDVVVGDAALKRKGQWIMFDKAKIIDALMGYIEPKIAKDAAADFTTTIDFFDGLDEKNYVEKIPELISSVVEATNGKLAEDASIQELTQLLTALGAVDPAGGAAVGMGGVDPSPNAGGKPGEGKPGEGKPGEGKPGEGKPGEGKPGEGKPGEGKPGDINNGGTATNPADPHNPSQPADPAAQAQGENLAKLKAYLSDKVTPEVLAQVEAIMTAKAKEEPNPNDPMNQNKPPLGGAPSPIGEDGVTKMVDEAAITKQAMDEAIAEAVKNATETTEKKQRDIRDAERIVRPYVGELATACDSAEEVYRAALTALGVKHEGIHESALPAILEMSGEKKKDEPAPAMDSASVSDYAARFPNAMKIGRA